LRVGAQLRTWLTSDIHFFHKNIILYCDRPYSDFNEMNEKIIAEWNRVVLPEDRVILVGDLSAGLGKQHAELAEIIGQLRGHKHLVRGNHDHETDDWYLSAGFERVTDWLLEDGKLFIHKPATDMNPEVTQICNSLEYDIIVHGHIHDKHRIIPGHFNVAWDRHYRMIDICEVADESKKD
jgi:calcineurin-like phosphoesterase family protein